MDADPLLARYAAYAASFTVPCPKCRPRVGPGVRDEGGSVNSHDCAEIYAGRLLVQGSTLPYFAGRALDWRIPIAPTLRVRDMKDFDPSEAAQVNYCEVRREHPWYHLVCHICEGGHHAHIAFGSLDS